MLRECRRCSCCTCFDTSVASKDPAQGKLNLPCNECFMRANLKLHASPWWSWQKEMEGVVGAFLVSKLIGQPSGHGSTSMWRLTMLVLDRWISASNSDIPMRLKLYHGSFECQMKQHTMQVSGRTGMGRSFDFLHRSVAQREASVYRILVCNNNLLATNLVAGIYWLPYPQFDIFFYSSRSFNKARCQSRSFRPWSCLSHSFCCYAASSLFLLPLPYLPCSAPMAMQPVSRPWSQRTSWSNHIVQRITRTHPQLSPAPLPLPLKRTHFRRPLFSQLREHTLLSKENALEY